MQIIELTIICESSSRPAFSLGISKEIEHSAREIIKFTKTILLRFTPQCGMKLTLDELRPGLGDDLGFGFSFYEGFIVKGQANCNDDSITFSVADRKATYDDSRITYVRKWQKKVYNDPLDGLIELNLSFLPALDAGKIVFLDLLRICKKGYFLPRAL